jgi:hypothetical protein
MTSSLLAGLMVSVTALENGVARLPPMGYNQWNFFHNNFNSSLFLQTSKFMKDKGFLAAGYNYMTLGGIGYANGSTCQPASLCNITRNATGLLFPRGGVVLCLVCFLPSTGFLYIMPQVSYKWIPFDSLAVTMDSPK